MPQKKAAKTTPAKKRAQAIAVRVVQTPPKIKPAEPPLPEAALAKSATPEPKKSPALKTAPQPAKAAVRPKTYVWIGAGASFALIIIGWIFFIKYYPAKKGPNTADQALANIGKVIGQATDVIKNQANKINDNLPGGPTPEELEILELDQKVFPEFYR